MDGKVCIVTGGVGGLGLASAKLLHREDASARIEPQACKVIVAREEEKFMQVSFKAAVVALTLAGSSMLMAGCVVAPGPGGGEAAFGYSDGYWDRGHNWHGWNSPQAAASFRAANGSHYYDRRHDQDNNQGWHDNDRYWQH
jgi:hypothetical protein